MHYAAMWGWAPVLCSLVEAEGDYNATINTGRTPLMLAVEYQNDLAVQYLCSIKKLHVNIADADGNTALILCACNGPDSNEIALTLLKAGADPNMENRKKKSPLSVACEDQNIDLVDILMDYKVLCNAMQCNAVIMVFSVLFNYIVHLRCVCFTLLAWLNILHYLYSCIRCKGAGRYLLNSKEVL
jgi:ankyrin repeat protein